MAVILAAIVISMTLRSDPTTQTPKSATPISHVISLSASRTLRASGFTVMAALLQISPELFRSSPNSTIFAIANSHISNASLPPHLLRDLLKYHTSPVRVSIEDLMEKPQGSCLLTLYQKKSLAITRIDRKNRMVQINWVWVSHPNLFVEGSVSIHGVLGPFAVVDPNYDVIHAPMCDSNLSVVSGSGGLKKKKSNVECGRIVRLLSSKGFVPFAIGLHSVLDGILEDERNVSSVTIFVPPRLELGAHHHPRALLEKIVRFHIVPQRLTHRELSALPARTLLRTMVHDDQPLSEPRERV
ncbi:putative FAS1 domain-containing protein [Rosa chinensis]|uniref:Putative FAS1 domain-containing protein n=1 Tax=Rosa chinensis TaxID=74649 RepID=A0A2P6PSM7_ROSCH|nr:fasciclin-like arabinogalactan protein 21 [Rosa chinensis]PRQ24943.1 putative FAS1 domain-containing protein [Rosa chinensis]